MCLATIRVHCIHSVLQINHLYIYIYIEVTRSIAMIEQMIVVTLRESVT